MREQVHSGIYAGVVVTAQVAFDQSSRREKLPLTRDRLEEGTAVATRSKYDRPARDGSVHQVIVLY